MPPNKEFRENPARAVYITGKIDQQLIDRLTPEINRLRASAIDAITAYVDSPGGSIYHAELLRQLLKTPNQDGLSCRLITVATGTAASAAADFLASGDYSIAYPHARVMYHGTRRISEEVLTRKGASTIAESLRLANEEYALRLADRCIDRIIFQFFLLQGEYPQIREQEGNAELTDAACFAHALRKKLQYQLRPLVKRVLKQQEEFERLSTFVQQKLSKARKRVGRPAALQAEILRTIVAFELKENPDPTWSFSTAGLTKISEDFILLRDYHSREHQSRRESMARRWGQYLLTEAEKADYESVPEDQKVAWVTDKTEDRIHPLWYFFISICRLLQEGEYYLSAQDAYWFGLVDEVPGSGLPNFRLLVEQVPAVAESSIASAQEKLPEQGDQKTAVAE